MIFPDSLVVLAHSSAKDIAIHHCDHGVQSDPRHFPEALLEWCDHRQRVGEAARLDQQILDVFSFLRDICVFGFGVRCVVYEQIEWIDSLLYLQNFVHRFVHFWEDLRTAHTPAWNFCHYTAKSVQIQRVPLTNMWWKSIRRGPASVNVQVMFSTSKRSS